MDPLVTVRQAAKPGPRLPQTDPPEESLWSTWQRLWKPKGTAVTNFYGPGKRLWLDRGEVESPLVYVHKGKLGDMPDASVIETGLPVASPGAREAAELPYWPSYRAATPEQRAVYWNWLLTGRNDPNIPIGYVFLYFYGLERRVLVDQQDFGAIADEVLRLVRVYHNSRSFVRYANGLLWTSIWLGIHKRDIRRKTLDRALRMGHWSERSWGLCLATLALLKIDVAEKLAYQLVRNDERSQRSVVTIRHADLHRTAFETTFQSCFPRGFQLKVPIGEYRFEYLPASATLGRLSDPGGPIANLRVPSRTALLDQLLPLIEIWGQSVEKLRAYDKAQQKTGGEIVTPAMYEALPESLRQGDHPHFDAWYQLMSRYVSSEGWTLLPVCELACLEGISERKKLTKTQSVQLASTAGFMGLALEPDPRVTGATYDWDEIVSVFPASEEFGQDVASYHAAAVLLELGVAIAAADGQVDEVELARLTDHLETQFDLSAHDVTRLEHLRYLLSRRPPRDFTAARTLQKSLTIEQRRVVGEFLVGIAGADAEISPPEVKALDRAYRALGLSRSDLDDLLRSARSSTGPSSSANESETSPTGGIQLDIDRINAIMAETAQVTAFLREALRDDLLSEPDIETDVEPVEPTATGVADGSGVERAIEHPELSAPGNEMRLKGMSVRFQTFAHLLLARPSWPRAEVETLARSEKLMFGAAFEAINEWAYDNLPDALLVESGDVIEVQQHLRG